MHLTDFDDPDPPAAPRQLLQRLHHSRRIRRQRIVAALVGVCVLGIAAGRQTMSFTDAGPSTPVAGEAVEPPPGSGTPPSAVAHDMRRVEVSWVPPGYELVPVSRQVLPGHATYTSWQSREGALLSLAVVPADSEQQGDEARVISGHGGRVYRFSMVDATVRRGVWIIDDERAVVVTATALDTEALVLLLDGVSLSTD